MTFTHGLDTSLFLGGANVTPFFRSASVDASKETVETTTFGSTAKTYIPGLRDATASLEGMFDGSESGSDATLEAILAATGGTEFSFYPETDAAGKYGYGMSGIQTAYAISSSTDDVVQASAEIQSVTGAERLQSLKALESVASTGTGGTVDSGAGTALGGAAYLHVTAMTGTSVTVKVEHSSNGSTWADLAVFSAQTAVGSQRKEFTGTVNRYVRTSYTLVGGAITFQVGVSRDLPRIP